MSELIADRRLCVTADRSRAVEANDPAAAYLLATPGTALPADDVRRLGLRVQDGKIVLPGAAPPKREPEPEPEPSEDEATPEGEPMPPRVVPSAPRQRTQSRRKR